MAAPFTQGNGVLTSTDPKQALSLAHKPAWVAVQIDVNNGQGPNPADVQALKNAGITVVGWQQNATQAGIDAVDKYGLSGMILGAESTDQLSSALSAASHLSVPVALVGNQPLYQPAGTVPPQITLMPEAYANVDGNHLQPNQVMAQAQATGAQSVMPIFGTYDGKSERGGVVPMDTYLANTPAGATYGAFALESMNGEQRANFGLPPTGSALPPPTAAPPMPAGSLPPAAAPATNQPAKAPPSPNNPSSNFFNNFPSLAGAQPPAQHAHPISPGTHDDTIKMAPPAPSNDSPPYAYSVGAGGIDWIYHHPNKIQYLADGSTQTITESGAVIKQSPGHSAYREGWVDPNAGYKMSTIAPSPTGNPNHSPYARATTPSGPSSPPTNPNPTYGPVPITPHPATTTHGHNPSPPTTSPAAPSSAPPTPPSPPSPSNNPTRALNSVSSSSPHHPSSTNTSTNINNSGIGPGSTSLALPPSPQPTADHYDAGGLAAANPANHAHGAQLQN